MKINSTRNNALEVAKLFTHAVSAENALLVVKIAMIQATIDAMEVYRESLAELKRTADQAATRKQLENGYKRKVQGDFVDRRVDWSRLSANVLDSARPLQLPV